MQLLIGLFPNASPQQLHTLAELAKGPRMMNQIPQSAPHLQKTFGAGRIAEWSRGQILTFAKIQDICACRAVGNNCLRSIDEWLRNMRR